MSTSNYNTFWKIINKSRVEIPIIQRDYTYGRESAARIRRRLVSDIFECLNNDTDFLHLDFIYGKLIGKENLNAFEKNKTNIKALLKTIQSYASDLEVNINYDVVAQTKEEAVKITFIPLDGQQRLTTLYLVHWYLIQHLELQEELVKLKKFSYATRVGAKDFCQLLTSTFFKIDNAELSLSDTIINNENYFSDWKKDPTVISMLAVIDEIDSVFNYKSIDFKILWHRLTKSESISFDFFDLDDFELTDELYIKMNARGKKLTHFENFKAWLIKQYEADISIPNWKNNFDIKWSDLFWSRKPLEQPTIDAEYLNYFKSQFLADFLKDFATKNPSASFEDVNSQIALLRDTSSNPIELFGDSDFFKNRINEYLNTLDVLATCDLDTVDYNAAILLDKYLDQTISKLLLHNSEVEKMTWWDITMHYAIQSYIKNFQIDSSFYQWLRVISNLIYNTPIEGPKLFVEASQSIDKLIEAFDNEDTFYEFLSKSDKLSIEFFTASQVEEEIKKATLIVGDLSWEKEFITIENNKYFFGQIGFIFNLIKDDLTVEVFQNVSHKVDTLFSHEVLNDKTYLLIRSFLTQGDCFIQVGSNLMFYSNTYGTLRNRNENWRRFFRYKLDFVASIINHKSFDKESPVKSLKKIIKVELRNVKDKYLIRFIENPKLLGFAGKRCIRKINEGFYILSKTRIYSYHVELYTYDWYLKFESNTSVDYFYAKNEEENPCLIITKDNREFYISFNNDSEKFELTNEAGILINKFDSIANAYNKLKTNA